MQLSETLRRYWPQALQSWQQEKEAKKEKEVAAHAQRLKTKDERAQVETRIDEIEKRTSRESYLRAIKPHVDGIAQVVPQLIPYVAAILDIHAELRNEAFELLSLRSQLGRDLHSSRSGAGPDDGPSLNVAINAVRAAVREAFLSRGELERARHLADMFMVDLSLSNRR